MISLLMKDHGGEFGLTLHTLGITSTIDVNSLLLSSIFPAMTKFPEDRDVIFDIKIPSLDFNFVEDKMKFSFSMFSNVVTHNPVDKRDELYLERADGTIIFI